MKQERSLVKSIVSVFYTKVFILFLSLLCIVLLAKSLGAEGRGLLAVLLVYPQLMISLTEGGMRQATTIFIGRKEVDEVHIFGALLTYIAIAGVFGYGLIFSILILFGSEQFDLIMIAVAAAMIPTSLVVSCIQGVFLGSYKILEFNKILWKQKLMYFLLLLALYLIELLNVTSAVIVTFIATLYNAIQASRYLKKTTDFRAKFDYSTLIEMLKLGVVYAVALFLIQVNYKIDLILLEKLASNKILGNYAVSVQVGEVLWQLPAAVMIVLISKTATSTESALNDLTATICQISRYTIAITMLSAMFLLTFTYYAIPLFLGSEFANVFGILLALAPGLIFATVFKTINSFYAGKGLPHYAIYIMLPTVLLNVVFNFLLIPRYGGIGAALASSISYFSSAVITLLFFTNQQKVSISSVIMMNKNDVKQAVNKIKSIRVR